VIGINRVVQMLPDALLAWQDFAMDAVGIGLVNAEAVSVDVHPAIVDFDQLTDVVVTSPMAATMLTDALNQRWPQWPIGIRFWAVGQSTANALPPACHCEIADPPGSQGLIPRMTDQLDARSRVLVCSQVGGGHQFDVMSQNVDSLTHLGLYRLIPVVAPELPNLGRLSHVLHGAATTLDAWLSLPQSVLRPAQAVTHLVTSADAEFLLPVGTRYHRVDAPTPQHVQTVIQGAPRVKGS
jgi:hypothetical protein